jgi:hypothetical protein
MLATTAVSKIASAFDAVRIWCLPLFAQALWAIGADCHGPIMGAAFPTISQECNP